MLRKFLFIVIVFLSGAAKADFNSALEAYQAGQFDTAYEAFLSMAKMGDKRSQFNLGVMYFNGEHVKRNVTNAYAWLKLATESENASTEELATFDLVKTKVETLDAAEAVYVELAEQYSAEALMRTLYPVLIKPQGAAAFSAKPIKIEPPEYPRKAAIKNISGWVQYQFDIDKKGVPRNLTLIDSFPDKTFVKVSTKAIKKWRFEPKMDSAGNPILDKAKIYRMEFLLGKEANYKVDEPAYSELKAKAAAGNAISQYQFGLIHKNFDQLDTSVNPNDWFLKAAVQDLPLAQYEIGRNLINGSGCESDTPKGLDWLARSAASGQSLAKQYLASIASESTLENSQQTALAMFKEEESRIGLEKFEVYALIDYAWLLASSPFEKIADPAKAIKMTEYLEDKQYWDEATPYEIKAAAFAKLGEFKKAVKLQEDALEEAEDMGADTSEIENRMALYRMNKTNI